MASSINSGNIKIMRSQVLLDTTDGGGQMTAHEVADGQSNNLFPDTSELDRAYGRINLRKGFLSVQTADTDSLMGANVIVADVPQDEQVNVTLFTTKNWFDRRAAAQDHIERYMARSVVWAGHLLEKQLIGQRAIQLALRETDDVPKVDQCLCLVENEDTPMEFEQYVRVTKVTTAMRMFSVGSGIVWLLGFISMGRWKTLVYAIISWVLSLLSLRAAIMRCFCKSIMHQLGQCRWWRLMPQRSK